MVVAVHGFLVWLLNDPQHPLRSVRYIGMILSMHVQHSALETASKRAAIPSCLRVMSRFPTCSEMPAPSASESGGNRTTTPSCVIRHGIQSVPAASPCQIRRSTVCLRRWRRACGSIRNAFYKRESVTHFLRKPLRPSRLRERLQLGYASPSIRPRTTPHDTPNSATARQSAACARKAGVRYSQSWMEDPSHSQYCLADWSLDYHSRTMRARTASA